VGNAMKTRIYILTIGLLTLFRCSQNKKNLKENYVETQPSFFQLKHGKWTVDTPKIKAVSLIIKFTEYETKKIHPK
jgi:hypothetical protein